MVGFSSAISSAAHDSDGKPAALTYSWVASSGMLAGATTREPDAVLHGGRRLDRHADGQRR